MRRPDASSLKLWESEDLILINKPPGLATLDERQGQAPSLLRWIRAVEPHATPCHRLDKETSGIMVWSRNEAAYKSVAKAFELRQVDKVYHAVVWGIHRFDRQELDLPIGTGRDGLMRIDYRDGKSAQTIVHSLEYFRHCTLLECRPVTGRTHQIRVHLASQNCRIVADHAYGGEDLFLSQLKGRKYRMPQDQEEESPVIKRLALHARALSIRQPELQVPEIEAPYPRDLEVLLRLLRKFDS